LFVFGLSPCTEARPRNRGGPWEESTEGTTKAPRWSRPRKGDDWIRRQREWL